MTKAEAERSASCCCLRDDGGAMGRGGMAAAHLAHTGPSRTHRSGLGEGDGVCDPRVFCASKKPSFLARWRVQGRPAVRGPAGTGSVGDGEAMAPGDQAQPPPDRSRGVRRNAGGGIHGAGVRCCGPRDSPRIRTERPGGASPADPGHAAALLLRSGRTEESWVDIGFAPGSCSSSRTTGTTGRSNRQGRG